MSGDDASRPEFDFVATTRRRWRREQKLAILAEVEAPGGSVSEVARRYSLHTSLLFRWRRNLSITSASKSETVQKPATFIPIALPAPEPAPAVESAKPSAIEIGIAGGRTVRVDTDVNTSALVRIIDALERKR